MSSLRVGGVKSGGRKPTLEPSRPSVVRNAFSFSAVAGLVFWICGVCLKGFGCGGGFFGFAGEHKILPVTYRRRACCPCALSSATAFLSKETNVSPPSQLPS